MKGKAIINISTSFLVLKITCLAVSLAHSALASRHRSLWNEGDNRMKQEGHIYAARAVQHGLTVVYGLDCQCHNA